MQVGLNLFSIKNLLTTEEEFFNTTKALKEMGYAYMQFSGAEFVPERIKRVSESLSMPVCLTHVPMDRIINETDQLMEEHALFGCKNIGLGMMPFEVVADEKRFKETVALLNAAGKRMAEKGFKFFYHHHHSEFFKHNGQTAFDYMVENAPYINFTVDTYWLQFGGVDVKDTLRKLKGRIECAHLKDYQIVYTEGGLPRPFAPEFAPIGDGVMDFPAIVGVMKEAGVKYFLVEQDNASRLPDTLAQVQRSVEYLKKL